MKKEIEFYNITDKLPEDYGDVIIFEKSQPMSFIGYYDKEEKGWYFLEGGLDCLLYTSCKEVNINVEYWGNFPTNF